MNIARLTSPWLAAKRSHVPPRSTLLDTDNLVFIQTTLTNITATTISRIKMGSISVDQYTDFRSIAVDGLPFFTPKQRVPVGTALLAPDDGVTEDTITPAFRPIAIRSKTFQNRIWVAPMCMYSCQDGMFSDFHVMHYGQWAMRGSALITLEATAVTQRVHLVTFSCGIP